ncbi:MAG: hypothetical protein ACI4KA_05395 [Oscillospiraceae bacterium]
MEIKGINRVMSTYKSNRSGNVKKTEASASLKNIDRVEFGFDTALQAAKNGISAEIKADATPQELSNAAQTAANGISASELASYILLG